MPIRAYTISSDRVGTAFVHRLVAAAHVTFEQELIVQFGDAERKRLALTKPRRLITVAGDETFHPQPCLVSIEPVSDFILLERYSEGCDAVSWGDEMRAATCDLDDRVVQAVSDEVNRLLAPAREGLGAHHSPDLFHVQHELMHATRLALARHVRQAAEQLEAVRARPPDHSEHDGGCGDLSAGAARAARRWRRRGRLRRSPERYRFRSHKVSRYVFGDLPIYHAGATGLAAALGGWRLFL
ncbi:MAG: hypothetical protein HYV63_30685 [Candidatus Schekmanbacteria bacterium]|nr:hypothetical protein [Candidatus Schekmanbacteria bacterium]